MRITAIAMPDWVERLRIRGLSASATFAWLRPSDARMLMRLDHEAGGDPYCAETWYRRCPQCDRPLIGDEAKMRMALDESAVTGRMKPCGPECYDAAKEKRWKKPRSLGL